MMDIMVEIMVEIMGNHGDHGGDHGDDSVLYDVGVDDVDHSVSHLHCAQKYGWLGGTPR